MQWPISKWTRRQPGLMLTGGSVLRGEVWRSVVLTHQWLSVLVSTQAILDNPAHRILYGVRVVGEDPGDMLPVEVIIDGQQCWIDVSGGLEKLRRGCLTERVDTLDAGVLETLDMRLRAVLDL